MKDLINRSMAVPSPCVRICELDAHDVCEGCGRSLDEIARWARMPDAERQVVVLRARARHEGRQAAG